MNNYLRAENAAVAEIERLLTEAGWSDGWGLDDDEVRNAPSPLFYRNATSAVAGEARVTEDGQTHLLYCIYNIIENHPHYAGNHPAAFDITIALTFYYDDPFLFYEAERNGFTKYLDALLDGLAESNWTLSGEGENPVPPTDDAQPYVQRKVLFVTNNF